MSNVKSFSYEWAKIDELYIKMRDMSGRVVYKVIVNINDVNKVAEALMFLEKYGLDWEKVYNIMKERKEEQKFYFNPNDENIFKI